MTEQPPPSPGGRVEPIDLQLEMQRSYLDYAMSVIVSRALPDVRDGLKPVHRRVLYAMYDGGYRPDRGFTKCARVVGDVMGSYHPHGDSAIYDTLVRLAQPWALRYPLVQGQGNFGSPGNDPAAAMRYCVTGDTLVRLADGSSVRIAALAPGAGTNSDTERRSQGHGPFRPARLGHQGVPLRGARHAAPSDTGGLRGHRDAQPPRPDPAVRRGRPDPALEPARRGISRRPRGPLAAAALRAGNRDAGTSSPRPSWPAPG